MGGVIDYNDAQRVRSLLTQWDGCIPRKYGILDFTFI